MSEIQTTPQPKLSLKEIQELEKRFLVADFQESLEILHALEGSLNTITAKSSNVNISENQLYKTIKIITQNGLNVENLDKYFNKNGILDRINESIFEYNDEGELVSRKDVSLGNNLKPLRFFCDYFIPERKKILVEYNEKENMELTILSDYQYDNSKQKKSHYAYYHQHNNKVLSYKRSSPNSPWKKSK